jgi:hypothetical protein
MKKRGILVKKEKKGLKILSKKNSQRKIGF